MRIAEDHSAKPHGGIRVDLHGQTFIVLDPDLTPQQKRALISELQQDGELQQDEEEAKI